MPTISVIMPAYNAEKTIKYAIESVLNQTYRDFELIVINDCSTDNTESVIANYVKKDSRVIHLNNQYNAGVSYTRNRAVECARGEWIAFLDSDDIWRSNKLEKQMCLVKSIDNAVLIYTASSFISSEGEPYSYILAAEEKIDYSTLLKKNLISCSSAVVKSSMMKKIKMPNDAMHEDYYVWLKILKEHKYAYGINEPLLIYRLSNNSKSSKRLKSAKMLYNTYRALGYSFVISSFLTGRYTIHSLRKRRNIKKTKV